MSREQWFQSTETQISLRQCTSSLNWGAQMPLLPGMLISGEVSLSCAFSLCQFHFLTTQTGSPCSESEGCWRPQLCIFHTLWSPKERCFSLCFHGTPAPNPREAFSAQCSLKPGEGGSLSRQTWILEAVFGDWQPCYSCVIQVKGGQWTCSAKEARGLGIQKS